MTARGATPEDLVRAGLPVEHLKIGECVLSRRPVLVTTVLGSCVTATFHHPGTGTGAAFHAMLPTRDMGREPGSLSCKYVDGAIEAVMRRMDALGVPRGELVTMLFGGGFTIQPERKLLVRDVVDVGRKNVEAARRCLALLGLSPRVERVLGSRGRKLFFHTATGAVWLRHVDASGREEPYDLCGGPGCGA